MKIYGRLGELIKSLNRMPGSITPAITALYGRRMATAAVCLSVVCTVSPTAALVFSLFLVLPPSLLSQGLQRENLMNLHGYGSTELIALSSTKETADVRQGSETGFLCLNTCR